MSCDIDTYLAACIYDKLSLLCWLQTDDAAKGRNRPKPIAGIISGMEKEKKREIQSYASGKDFDKAWKELTRKNNGD